MTPLALREKCLNTEFFLSEYRKMRTRKNSVSGHFSRSVSYRSSNLSFIALKTMQLLVQIPFSDKFSPKNQNCQIILKFGTQTNLNMQKSMPMFILPVFDRKYPFWANLILKFKIV